MSTASMAPPPPVVELLVKVFDDFRDHFLDRMLAGLGMFLVLMPVMGVGMVGVYVPMLAGAGLGAAVDDEVVMILGMFGGLFVGIALMILVSVIVITPLYASLGRAIVKNLADGSDLTFAAPFSTLTRDLGKVLGTSLLVGVLAIIGSMFCYLPGILVGVATGFALPAVIVHRLGPIDAIRRSVAHVMAEPAWHVGFFAVSMGIGLVLTYVPLIGPALVYVFVLSFQLRAYVHVFGMD